MESVGQLKTEPSPGIGADTAAILGELGYTEEEIGQMTANGAVACGAGRKG
jgi:crotonobetainyl-CoA:carnitine CoA-transferase CaiB-like acyl-CoA transferase